MGTRTPAGRTTADDVLTGVSVRVATRRLVTALAVLLLALAVGHAVSMALRFGLGRDYAFGLVPLLDLNDERSIGTWVTAALLLGCAQIAVLCGLAARRRGEHWQRNWWLLAAVLTVMSADEVATMHEDLIPPMRAVFGLSGVLYYGWVIPLVAAGAVFLLVQLRFLRHLGRPTGLRLVAAGVVYVSGAAGLELVQSVLAESGAKFDAPYAAAAGLEEVMELAGVMVALWALSSHLASALVGHGLTRSLPPASRLQDRARLPGEDERAGDATRDQTGPAQVPVAR